MRKKIFVILLTLISTVCLAFGVAACGNGESSSDSGTGSTTKQTPVYQGMVISSADTATATSAKLTSATLAADQYGEQNVDYGGQYGDDYFYYNHHYRGDYEGKDSDVDADQPYGDDAPTIEQEIETTLQVTGTGQSIYYADKEENIYITIKFSNPDSYEILSFVLNGTKYTSYMFQNGSDLENIIVKLNVGSVGGILEYTIDEIKYVDGTAIKDVLLNGDTVVKCGVRADDQTYATISNETHDLDSISFDVKIVDLYSLIEYSDGYAMAVLYDGDSLVQTIDLTVGTNTVQFTNLTPNTLYQYAVVALYDDLSGTGTALNYLYKNAVYTDTIVLFDNITVGQEAISFGYSWYEGYSAATITQLTLALNGKTQTLQSTATSVSDLLSNTEYVLTASYVNLDGEPENITLTFTTLEKATPSVEISTLTSTKTSVNYTLSITDTDGVGSLASATLSLNGKTIQTLTTAVGSFSNLLSNNTYTLTVVYTYDLNDGEGEQTIKVSKDIKTEAKATPVVVIDELTSDQTTIDYELAITDADSVGSITSVTLTLGETKINTLTTANGSFSGLLSNNTYTLTVVYAYDLNDGEGEQTIKVSKDIKTEAKATPVVAIDELTSDQTTIDYELAITDADGVGSITSVTLTLGDTKINTLTTANGSFSNLLSNNTYTLTVVYTYDLNDGEGEQTIKVSKDIKTEAKATPVVAIDKLTSDQTTVDYELAITDADGVGSITSVTLTLCETKINTLTTAIGSFSGLLSNNTYTLTVVYTYDLNDGEEEQTKEVTKTITTKTKAAPSVDIEFTDSDTTSLAFGLTYTDKDSVGEITAIGLYSGSTLVEEITDFTQTALNFSGLTSYTKYTLIVEYKYNLNDGNNETQTSESLSVYTNPVIEFESISVLNTSAVSEGETIVIQAKMNNPNKATFVSVVINGETYEVSEVSTSTSLRAEIVYEGQFEGGNTALTITQVICTLGGNTYTVDISSGNTAYVFINGELAVNEISVVRVNDGGEYEESYYGFYSEQLYYKLALSNATCYDVYSVTIGDTTYDSSSITMSTDCQTVYIAISNSWYGWREYTLSSISYSNSSLDKTKPIDLSVAYMRLRDDNIYEITDADDLLDVDDYKYYKLINDIDLAGYEWANKDNYMRGIFDGNGYTISNMSAVTTYTDTALYLGLFAYVEGIVTNLNITDALYMVTVNNSTGNSYGVYAGGIAARTDSYIIIDGCNVEISIQITNNNTNGETRVGGIFGYISTSYVAIKNIEVEAVFVTTTSSNNYATLIGGIAGYMGCWQKATVSDIVVNLSATISANSYSAGEYFGEYYYSGTLDFKNSTADYTITYKNYDIIYYGVDDFKFSYSNGVYSLIGYYGSDTDIVLPDSINGSNYTIGSNAFSNNSTIKSIIIPDSVTVIGSYAFYNCTSLVSVTICDSNSSKSSRIVGGYTCETDIENIDGSIGSYAFYNCAALTSVIMGNNITTIGSCAFGNCTALTNITIGSGVTTIYNYVFDNCTAEIIWSDNIAITEIGNYAFGGYAGESLLIPSSVITLCDYAFYNCTAEIIWADDINLTEISSYAFAGYKGASLTIPDSVTAIKSNAFYNCTALINVTLGNGVKSIGNNAFENCTALASIIIPARVTSIGENAFYNCSCVIVAEAESKPDGWNTNWNSNNCLVLWGMTEVPTQEVTYSFVTNGGSSVESITAVYLSSLPASTQDGYAFGGWYTSSDFSGTAVTAPYCSLTDVTLYAKWYDLSGATQSEGLEIVDGVIVGIGTCTDTILHICMPVAASAFYGCEQITAVYLYDGCTSIGYQAFNYCNNLKTVYFYQTEMPTLGSDIFANTWDASDFAVYVLAGLYSDYQNVSDSCWQNSIVSACKLYTIE